MLALWRSLCAGRWCQCFDRMATATSSHYASLSMLSQVGVQRWRIRPWVTLLRLWRSSSCSRRASLQQPKVWDGGTEMCWHLDSTCCWICRNLVEWRLPCIDNGQCRKTKCRMSGNLGRVEMHFWKSRDQPRVIIYDTFWRFRHRRFFRFLDSPSFLFLHAAWPKWWLEPLVQLTVTYLAPTGIWTCARLKCLLIVSMSARLLLHEVSTVSVSCTLVSYNPGNWNWLRVQYPKSCLTEVLCSIHSCTIYRSIQDLYRPACCVGLCLAGLDPLW